MNHYIVHDGNIQLCSYCWDKKVTYQDWCCRLHYFLEKARRIHGNKYNYEKFVYKGATKQGIIICPDHGEFLQSPNTHYRGSGCQKCGRIRTYKSRKKGLSYYVSKAKKIHKNFYDYSKFVYDNPTNKSLIICPHHGEFRQEMIVHVRNHGCPKCKGEKIRSSLSMGRDVFIRRANKIHNHKYDYSKVIYKNVSTKGCIICPDHGEFRQLIKDHLRGFGCPKCNSVYSKQCIKWLNNIMDSEHINIRHAENGGEYILPGTCLKLDGYCEETDTAYEYYGDFWHGNPSIYEAKKLNKKTGETMGELYNKTIRREKIVKKYVSNIIVMWESEYKNKNLDSK